MSQGGSEGAEREHERMSGCEVRRVGRWVGAWVGMCMCERPRLQVQPSLCKSNACITAHCMNGLFKYEATLRPRVAGFWCDPHNIAQTLLPCPLLPGLFVNLF